MKKVFRKVLGMTPSAFRLRTGTGGANSEQGSMEKEEQT